MLAACGFQTGSLSSLRALGEVAGTASESKGVVHGAGGVILMDFLFIHFYSGPGNFLFICFYSGPGQLCICFYSGITFKTSLN